MTIEEIVLKIKTSGWCVIEDVIPPGKVDAIRKSVEETTAADGVDSPIRGVTTRKGLLAFNQSFAPYLADKRILSIADNFFGSHFRISFTSAHINLPGNERGGWHADWPFNQNNAGHIPAPYSDAVMHLTTLWMLSPFTSESGATWIVPGSHSETNNPTGNNGVDPNTPHPDEIQATGRAGSVLVLDSRMWHATAVNNSDKPRVGVAVRYAPWWLNLDSLKPGSVQRVRMSDETGTFEPDQVPISADIYESLSNSVKPLFRHWVAE